MPTLYTIKRKKGTAPYTLTKEELRESKTSFGYDYWGKRSLYDEDEEYAGEETYYVSYYKSLEYAVDLASHSHYSDFRYDTWIVNDNGAVVAVISFDVNITYP